MLRVTITETREYTVVCFESDTLSAAGLCRTKFTALYPLGPNCKVTERFYLVGQSDTGTDGETCLCDSDIDHTPSTTKDVSA